MSQFNGKWDVVVHTFMGDQRSEHIFQVKDNLLTGTIMDIGSGNIVNITSGILNGNKINYQFTIKIPIGEMEFTMEGEMSEDETIHGTSSNAMGSFEYEAVRSSN